MVEENPRIGPVERATGRTWDDWLRFMDARGAADLDHGQIAAAVHAELEGTTESAGWWAQSVAVAYEQHIGRRVRGQRADGTFEVSVSRATPLAMAELMERWAAFAAADGAVRSLVTGEPRVSGTGRRMTWRAAARDGSAVAVTSEPKKNGTASLVATQTKVATPAANEEARAWWTATVARFLGGV
ncbi:hypothetical protein V2J56_07295 [Georgenia sp. MJ206]|uniref:hypothetical protein n=1 Tax=Georgenia wangjunii TaxID=3117730 RepID=UPI002F268F50